MKLKNYLILILISTITLNIYSQDKNEEKKENIPKKKSEFWKKVTFGGGLGLNFSNSVTTVTVAPNAVYNFSSKISAGAGVNFGYSGNSTFNQTNYGASILGLYNPVNSLQFSSEFEYLFVNQRVGGLKNDFNFPAFYIGAGYRFRNVIAGLRYDLLYDENKNIYGNALSPFLRVSF